MNILKHVCTLLHCECNNTEASNVKIQQYPNKNKWDWIKYLASVVIVIVLTIAILLLLNKYKEGYLFGSDIPVKWFTDIVIVCISILLFILTYKLFVAFIRYSFYIFFRHDRNMDVLNEAVNVSQVLLNLEENNNIKKDPEEMWYTTISKAYISLGKIEKIYNELGFFHSDKKKISSLYSTLRNEVDKVVKMEKKEANDTIVQSLRSVNSAIGCYLKEL